MYMIEYELNKQAISFLMLFYYLKYFHSVLFLLYYK